MNLLLNLSEKIKKFASELDINAELHLSDLAYHKFILSITRSLGSVLEKNEFRCLSCNLKHESHPDTIKKIKYLYLLTYLSLKIYLSFFLFALLYKIILKSFKLDFSPPKKVKYFFISPVRKVSKFDLIHKLFRENYLSAFILTSNISLVHNINKRILKKENEQFMHLVIPNPKLLLRMLSYTFRKGIYFHQILNNLFNKVNHKVNILIFHDKFFKMILYEYWAKLTVSHLKDNYPNAIYILENDLSGQLMALTEELNNEGIKTIQLQHGSYFRDNIWYIQPLCKYMLCCSEREKQIQIEAGVDPSNLFVYGAPLQTLIESKNYDKNTISHFDIVILGGGPQWYMDEIKSILKGFDVKCKEKKIRLRHHPVISKNYKKIWEDLVPGAIISDNETLSEDIQSGKLIISFSIDTLISCLRKDKKTIYCTPYHKSNKKTYDILLNMPFIKFADTRERLFQAIDYFEDISNDNLSDMVCDSFVDYNFGISDLRTVSKNLNDALKIIHGN